MSPGWERGRVSRAMSTLWDSSEGPSCIGEKSLLIDFLSRVRFAQFDGRTRSVFCESTFFGRFRPCRFAGSAERTLPQRKLNDSSNTQHRSEEHTSELQSLMRISYAVFCLKKKKKQ